jgi:predicted enzyme related to lactoylglutathione lyase
MAESSTGRSPNADCTALTGPALSGPPPWSSDGRACGLSRATTLDEGDRRRTYSEDVNSAACSWSGLTVDCGDPQLVGRFWAGLLDLPLGIDDDLPGWVRLGALGTTQPVLNFQPVPEPKNGKTRIHLDVRVDDVDVGVALVVELGGRSLDQRYDYDAGVVVTMADPEGNEFCLVQYFD